MRMATPGDFSDRKWRLAIVGGGPAAARQLRWSGGRPQDVCIISAAWHNGMSFMGSGTMQSYVDELDVGDGGEALRALLADDHIQPTAAQYDSYVRTTLRSSGATLVTARLSGISRVPDGLRLAVADGQAATTLTADRVVLATGSRPRKPPAEWAAAGAATYDAFHRMTRVERARLCAGRAVLVVGSGNSALQTATLAASFATDTTVLANRYHGLYPFETDDRFAWRSQSALACEMVVKGATRCHVAGGTTPCLRLLVYGSLTRTGDDLEFTYYQDRNEDLLARCSLPPRCPHTAATSLPGPRRGWIERRCLDDVVVLWATGCQPVYPDVEILRGLPRDAAGYLYTDAAGATAVPGLYLTGACSGQRAVNEMRPALEARLDELDEVTQERAESAEVKSRDVVFRG